MPVCVGRAPRAPARASSFARSYAPELVNAGVLQDHRAWVTGLCRATAARPRYQRPVRGHRQTSGARRGGSSAATTSSLFETSWHLALVSWSRAAPLFSWPP